MGKALLDGVGRATRAGLRGEVGTNFQLYAALSMGAWVIKERICLNLMGPTPRLHPTFKHGHQIHQPTGPLGVYGNFPGRLFEVEGAQHDHTQFPTSSFVPDGTRDRGLQ